MSANDYTIGKGKLLFQSDGSNGYRDLGNCPDFKITVATEKKEHFSSRSGLQTKDLEVIVKQTATGSLILDEPVIENLQLFAMSGAPDDISQTGASIADQSINGYFDLWILLGKKTLTNVVVTDDPETVTYTVDVDYSLDLANGLIKIISTGAITDGQALLVDYDYATQTIKRLDAAETTTMKGHIYFAGDPPAGRKLDVKGYVSMLPEGDLSLIGEDWLELGLTIEFLTHANYVGLFEIIDKGVVV